MISKKKKENNEVKSSIANTQGEIKKMKDKIDQEMEKQKKNDEEVQVIQNQIIEKKRQIQNSKIGAIDPSQQTSSTLQSKQIQILENRLEKASQKLNESISANQHLRMSIDDLIKEKSIFEEVYGRLEKQLLQKRKEMGEIIELANTAYEERDKIQEKLATLIQ